MTAHPFEKLQRTRVPALDRILGTPFPVLDDGFVRVVDYMGCDAAVVQAARVSYGKGTKRVSQDRELLRYLIRHGHTTPFEMCEIKFHLRVPMDCWRQWIRHRTASVNEYSTRYSEAIASAHRTPPGQWRVQSKANRQGSVGFVAPSEGRVLSRQEAELQRLAKTVYAMRLRSGVAREQARKDLPLSTFTEAYWKIDLHNLMHFLRLRMHPSAQFEIRQYAELMGREIVRRWVPLTWEAFEDYVLEAVTLSAPEQALASALAAGGGAKALKAARAAGYLVEKDKVEKPTLEGREVAEKFKKLGLKVPWGA
jgi:thymidylate synthase (FAD)